ncbi:AraC family transcriptional regulator [Paenibacillus sp. J5C_2022]|uniref:AraC family transcriptional regulator n=1 Tax=Paenibacillus sp. J5C2022 TaxID=2977129 RepID=UPI0021CF449C|nr:AraC family transcriptional regulator [Paenibacillus sp. J5C2022]MCU6710219.1 AraC family transcriptional regulator [Paenibacillus sp. J5C2022]
MQRKMSIRLRVTLLAASLAVLPILIIGTMTYLFAERTLVAEAKRMSNMSVQQVQARIEDMLADIDRTVRQAMTRDDLNLLLLEGELLRHEYETNNVLAMLASIESLVEYADSVYLYLPVSDKVLTANGTRGRKEELLDKSLLQAMENNDETVFWHEHQSPDALSASLDGTVRRLEGVSYVRRIPAISPEPLGYFIVSVNEEALFRIFQHTEWSESGGMLLATPAGNLYPGPHTEEWLSHPGFLEQVDMLLEENNGQREHRPETVKLDGQRYLLGAMASERNGLQYISVIPYSQLTKHIGIIRNWLIVLCSVLAVLLLWVLLRLSRSIYNRVASRWTVMERAHSSLTHRLKASLPDLKAHYLRQWLSGKVPAGGLARLAQEGLDMRGAAYVAVCMEWNDANRYTGKDMQRLMEEMIACGERAAGRQTEDEASEASVMHFVRMGSDLIGGVIVYPPDGHSHNDHSHDMELPASALSSIRQMFDRITDGLQQVVTVGVGAMVINEGDVGNSYREAMAALQRRLLEGSGHIYVYRTGYEERQSEEARLGTYPYQLEREIVLQLKLGKLSEAGRSLQAFTELLLSHEGLTKEDVLQAFAMLHASVYRIPLEASSPAASTELSGGELSNIYRFKTVMDIQAWFQHELFPRIVESIQLERVAAKSASAQREAFSAEEAKSYIHDRYNEDISLQLAAEQFGMSEFTFGQAFKGEVGVTFSDYVLAYRMEKGKQLLLETDMKVADIAEHLRYNNSQNFIRIFKRITGMTPGQFRKGKQ